MRYQLFPGVQLSIIGLSVRLMQVLELGPLLTGLVLTGRVGARMTAEIGTMRVTEQIDALETLSYDPRGLPHRAAPARVRSSCCPRWSSSPTRRACSAATSVSVYATDVTKQDFIDGVRLGFGTFQVVYSLIKATLFGARDRVHLLLRGLRDRGRARRGWAGPPRRRWSSPRWPSSSSIR